MEYWWLVLFIISSLFSKATIGLRDGMSSIVGGQYAGKKTVTENGIEYLTTTEFPYMVAIEYFGTGVCGGSIVSTSRVLTAAHCVKGMCKFALNVRAGTFIRESNTDTYKQKVGVKSFKVHEQYRKKLKIPDYDIAIVQLSENFVFNDYVNKIQLPMGLEHVDFEKREVIAIGFGETQTEEFPKFLRKTTLRITIQSTCELLLNIADSHSMICARSDSKSSTMCFGDSGGPLIIGHNNRNPTEDVLLGIAAKTFLKEDEDANVRCNPSKPAMFVDVRDHLEWLYCNLNLDLGAKCTIL